MHPLFIISFIVCAGWFFSCTAMAGRGLGACIGFAFLGVVEFVVLTIILDQSMRHQDFFRDALRAGPDINAIMMYIVLPSLIVIFLSGLFLKRILSRPAR